MDGLANRRLKPTRPLSVRIHVAAACGLGADVDSEATVAWQLWVETRKGILESQRIRAKMIWFTIGFVSAGVGVIAASVHTLDRGRRRAGA